MISTKNLSYIASVDHFNEYYVAPTLDTLWHIRHANDFLRERCPLILYGESVPSALQDTHLIKGLYFLTLNSKLIMIKSVSLIVFFF